MRKACRRPVKTGGLQAFCVCGAVRDGQKSYGEAASFGAELYTNFLDTAGLPTRPLLRVFRAVFGREQDSTNRLPAGGRKPNGCRRMS